jgi:hypothetical protein
MIHLWKLSKLQKQGINSTTARFTLPGVEQAGPYADMMAPHLDPSISSMHMNPKIRRI